MSRAQATRRDRRAHCHWHCHQTISVVTHNTPKIQTRHVLNLERAGGIEPPRPVWKTGVLPLNYARTTWPKASPDRDTAVKLAEKKTGSASCIAP